MKCEHCGYSQEAAFNICPACNVLRSDVKERLDAGADLAGKGTQSNIAYVGIEMRGKKAGDALGYGLWQIDLFKDKKPAAWFVDIIHSPKEIVEAMWVQDEMKKKLRELMPWQKHGADSVVVETNLDYVGKLKARDQMTKIINDHKKAGQAENVKYRDARGRELPIEY